MIFSRIVSNALPVPRSGRAYDLYGIRKRKYDAILPYGDIVYGQLCRNVDFGLLLFTSITA
jgi:hypothetical protein